MVYLGASLNSLASETGDLLARIELSHNTKGTVSLMKLLSSSSATALDAWVQDINRACGSFAGRHLGEGFAGQIKSLSSGPLSISVLQAREVMLSRTDIDIATDDDDKFFAVFQLDGKCGLDLNGCAAELGPGYMVVIDASSPFSATYKATSRMISVILPRSQVEQQLRHAQVRCGEVVSERSPSVRLASQLMQFTARQSDMNARDGEAALEALLALLGPVMAPREELDSYESLFQQAVAFIDAHIREGDLCPELIGRQIGISVRGLYRVFTRRGLTVAQYIKCRRLDLCAEVLRRAPVGQSLSLLSGEWGFSDPSSFSHAFKARFGISPSEYRKRHG